MALPYTVAEDSSGNVYFADQANNRVRKLTNGGGTFTVSTVAGTGSAGWTGDGGPATSATLNAPCCVALDSLGNLYVTDTSNVVIRQINLTTNTINTVAGVFGGGCSPTTKCGDGGLATAATFTSPLGISVDGSGNLYIADYLGYRVRAVNMGKTTAKLAGISVAAGDIATVAGNGSQGDCSFNKTCNGQATKLGINHPGDTAVDSAGNLYFTDQWNNSVRIVSTAGVMTNYALAGNPGPLGDGGPAATKGNMWNPLMLTLDPSANLYISGGNDNVVQRVDVLTTGLGGPHEIGTVAGSATFPTIGGFGGDGGSATSSSTKLSNLGSSVDASGNLYIADGGNNRIRYVPLAPAGSSSVPTLSLGTWAIGTHGSPRSLTFSSTGGAELVVSSINITGANSSEFAQTNTCGTAPVSMGPDAACNVTVTLTPSGYGTQTATLTFTDNASNNPQTVTLSGSGPYFTASASPNAIKVAQGAQGTLTISLTPVAKFNQTVTLTVSGCPANTTCTLAQGQVTMTGGSVSTDVLTIQAQSTAPVGTYTLKVTSTFQNLVTNTNITLKIIK